MILKNKLAIKNNLELADVEEKISKQKAIELFKSEKLNQLKPGSISSLLEIHEFLFSDIYDFTGKIRDVNIAKGGFRFVPSMYLLDALKKIEKMPQTNFEQIIEKYIEMNIAHPFREGNGRATRIWLDLILKKELNLIINWEIVDKEDYLLAMQRSPIKDLELKTLLKNALTNKVNDKLVYMKGLDASYNYEGYSKYNSIDIELNK